MQPESNAWSAEKIPPRAARPIVRLCLGIVAFVAGSAAYGVELPRVPAAPSKLSPFTMRDWRLTVSARNALDKDSVLSPLNLGVSVRDGVAILWGSVSSVALAARAVDRVRALPGLDDVRSELHLIPATNVVTPKRLAPPAPLGPATPGTLTGRREAAHDQGKETRPQPTMGGVSLLPPAGLSAPKSNGSPPSATLLRPEQAADSNRNRP